MAFYLGTLDLPTQKKQQMVDITARVRAEVKSSGVQNGLCSVFAPHSTGAIAINENTDPDVQTDILNALERAVPEKGKFDGPRNRKLTVTVLG
jgi:secondary thiamine-phosphate synthase enzyme